MSFKEWLSWLKGLPPLLRWFPVLIVLRPVIDNFYFLKEIHPLVSPPNLVGVLTPALCLIAMMKYRYPGKGSVDNAFAFWAVVIVFNCILLLFYDPFSLLTFEFLLKISLPVYLFLFLRIFIVSRRDLHGILTAFLYSGIFVAGLLLYEIIVQPISVQESRGLERIQGSFGDVVSYGMYIVFSLIAATYFYFSRTRQSLTKRMTLIGVVAVLGLVGLVNIHHTATYTVFTLIVIFFLLRNFREGNPAVAFAVILALGVAIDFAGSEVIDEKITPLVQTDLQVYAGEVESDRLLHGRMGRWRMMLDHFSGQSVPVQFFGYPLKFEYVYHFIGIGSHNDFLRMLFAGGIAGLVGYVAFLIAVFRKSRLLEASRRYLVGVGFIALLLYSISVTPTMYAPFMYFILSIFAYVALPTHQTSE